MSLFTALVSTLLLAQAQPPAPVPKWSVEITPDGIKLDAIVGGQKTELSALKLGPVTDVVRRGDILYVARSAGGIQIVDATDPRAPVAAGGFGEATVVTHLALSGEQLAAMSATQSFLVYDLTDPLHPRLFSGLTSSDEVRPPAHGTVFTAHDGVVVIEGGTDQGFAQGQNIAIYSKSHVSEKDRVAREAGMQSHGALVAVVRLERVEATRSLGSYGRGENPMPGDAVVTTNDLITASLVAPPMIPFEWRLDLALRPFLGVGSSDGYTFGVLTDVSVTYYFQDIPLRLEVGVVPFGLVVGGSVPYNPVVFDATVAFYSQFFEFGLGGGVSTVVTPAAALQPQSWDTQGTFDQTLRIGAIDGLNFIWTSSLGSAGNTFDLAAASAQFNIPLTPHVTLGFEGGGGRGYAYGDAVLRTYVGGLGGPGTWIISAGLGGAETVATIPTNNQFFTITQSTAGPALVLELEVRL